jgi:AcrR family transcriptional regulator
MQQQNFDDIKVQDILDRARISRSTFYTHYTDKQDLFLSDLEDFLQLVATLLTRRGAPPRRLFPIQEFFAHAGDVRPLHQAMAEKLADLRELGMGFFSRSIAGRLTAASVELPPPELQATAHVLAGNVFSLLDWWLAQPEPPSPAEMDALFHRLAWRGLRPKKPRLSTVV